MDFENSCPIVDVVIDLPLRDKRALLHDLGHRAALALKVDGAIVFNALLKREELGSTGVGNGVAIPHVRLEQVKKSFGSWRDCETRSTSTPSMDNWLTSFAC